MNQAYNTIDIKMESSKELYFRVQTLTKENQRLSKNIKNFKLRNEELKSENQLLKNQIAKIPGNLLPKELKQMPQSKTLRFKMATILYLDIQGFKDISTQSNSAEVIDELDQIIFHFNSIVYKYKIIKVKTIGDSYMCAGGVPVKNITNPLDIALAALEMKEYLCSLKREYEKNGKKFWDLRLGIHTGPVKATVVGVKKIAYDLKGDTVNIATRIASASDIGQISISIMTYELIKQYFDFDYHGKIPVKYKGNMEMFDLKGLKKKYSVKNEIGIIPNDMFHTKYLMRQFTDLQEIILDKLEQELPSFLYYHNCKHTIDVVNQSELIGYGEGVDDESILLLMTAALFHDSGHIIGYENHEYYSTQIAREWLAKYNYTQEQIEQVCDLIMATKLPPNPKNLLHKIMCDADLDYLGRSDFIPISDTLYRELKAQNKISSLNQWNKRQVEFLIKHHFYTDTANDLREVNKQAQIERIKSLVDWDKD